MSIIQPSSNLAYQDVLRTVKGHISQTQTEIIQIFDHYSLKDLGLTQAVHERDLERSLLARLKDFMIELGYGFWRKFIIDNS